MGNGAHVSGLAWRGLIEIKCCFDVGFAEQRLHMLRTIDILSRGIVGVVVTIKMHLAWPVV